MKTILRCILLVGILWMSVQKGVAQDSDSLSVDSTLIDESLEKDSSSYIFKDSLIVIDTVESGKVRFKLIKSILDKKYPNPNRAAAMSFLLPGSGQIYNKKIWKLPFVYGALGGLGYMAWFNNKNYKIYKEAYLFEVDDEDLTINPFSTLDEGSLLTIRDRYNKRRQQGYIFFVLTWVLNSVDAYVDAHLTSFDVNEDISMHFNPVALRVANTNACGLSIQFTHHSKSVKTLPFQY